MEPRLLSYRFKLKLVREFFSFNIACPRNYIFSGFIPSLFLYKFRVKLVREGRFFNPSDKFEIFSEFSPKLL